MKKDLTYMILPVALIALSLVLPVEVYAETFKELIENKINPLINPLIGTLTGVALAAFIWCLVKFIYALSAGDEKGTDAGKKCMTWGIIAIFVLFSFWGIVRLVQNSVFSTTPSSPISF